MQRSIVVVTVLVGLLILPLILNKCGHRKPPPDVPLTAPPAPMRDIPEKKSIHYGLTFAMAPMQDNDPKDVASLTCDSVGDQTLERPYKGDCNPQVGDTSCRMVLPVLCIKPGSHERPAPLSGHGWSRGDLAASQAVMGAQLDSELQGDAMCKREFGMAWRMAAFADGRNYMDTPQYDHLERGDHWGLQGKLGPGLGGYGRYWVKSGEPGANCWE